MDFQTSVVVLVFLGINQSKLSPGCIKLKTIVITITILCCVRPSDAHHILTKTIPLILLFSHFVQNENKFRLATPASTLQFTF